jgi:hypothetical protein
LTFAGPISGDGGGENMPHNQVVRKTKTNIYEEILSNRLFKSMTCETSYSNSANSDFLITIIPNDVFQFAGLFIRDQGKIQKYKSPIAVTIINSCEKHPVGCGGILFYTNVTLEFDLNKKIELQFPESQSTGHGLYTVSNKLIGLSCNLRY